MSDNFDRHHVGLESPYEDGAAVTPSDTEELDVASRALWIGGAGDGTLRVTTVKGTTLNFVGVPAGRILPVRAKRVHSTATGVTGIVALW